MQQTNLTRSTWQMYLPVRESFSNLAAQIAPTIDSAQLRVTQRVNWDSDTVSFVGIVQVGPDKLPYTPVKKRKQIVSAGLILRRDSRLPLGESLMPIVCDPKYESVTVEALLPTLKEFGITHYDVNGQVFHRHTGIRLA